MDAATKKLFAAVDGLTKKLEELNTRLDALDTNGALDEIRKEMKVVSANSQVVVNVVEAHGSVLEQMEKTVRRLRMRCPLLKPGTEEIEPVRTEPRRDRPSSSEYRALAVAVKEEDEPE